MTNQLREMTLESIADYLQVFCPDKVERELVFEKSRDVAFTWCFHVYTEREVCRHIIWIFPECCHQWHCYQV